MGQPPRVIANSGPRPRTIADEQELSDLNLARGHALWRNNLVAKVLCYLSVMRALELIPAGSKVYCPPPGLPPPQDYGSTDQHQAAHYLPGVLGIVCPPRIPKPLYVWECLQDGETQSRLLGLFQETQDLPVDYNRADSAAEARRTKGHAGLKQAFEQASQIVLDGAPIHSIGTGQRLIVVNRPLVRLAYNHWVERSLRAYEVAAAGKREQIEKNRPASVVSGGRTDLSRGILNEYSPEDLEARTRDLNRQVSGRKATVEEFGDQERFLRSYGYATGSGFPLSELLIKEIESQFEPRQ